jgi:tetratricopeptide (TPR) repeat protein
MIRRDYLLRVIEEFVAMLTGIRRRIAAGEFAEAGEDLDREFQNLVGKGADAVSKLSETELLAQLTTDGPTHVVRQKSLMLVALLQEAGQLHMAEGREEDARACWIKALDVALMLQLQDADVELPEFVPKIEMLHEQLRDGPLPLRTQAALWRHYEQVGAYGRAEDVLFTLREAEPDNQALTAEAKLFYGRLLRQSDGALEAGNLPRDEVAAGLAALN